MKYVAGQKTARAWTANSVTNDHGDCRDARSVSADVLAGQRRRIIFTVAPLELTRRSTNCWTLPGRYCNHRVSPSSQMSEVRFYNIQCDRATGWMNKYPPSAPETGAKQRYGIVTVKERDEQIAGRSARPTIWKNGHPPKTVNSDAPVIITLPLCSHLSNLFQRGMSSMAFNDKAPVIRGWKRTLIALGLDNGNYHRFVQPDRREERFRTFTSEQMVPVCSQ